MKFSDNSRARFFNNEEAGKLLAAIREKSLKTHDQCHLSLYRGLLMGTVFSLQVDDIWQARGIITTVMLFLVPVFYPLSALPEKYQMFLFINSLIFIIEEARPALLFGQMPDWTGWGVYSCVSLLIAWTGFRWFQKTRKGFADVL